MRKSSIALFLTGLLLVSGSVLLAHHSVSAEFDVTKKIEFTGTVKKVEWMNPHIYTQVETKDDSGKVLVYRVEGGAPNSLFRSGWRADSLKPGDVVKISGNRAKSATSMNIGQATITSVDGKRFFSGQNQ